MPFLGKIMCAIALYGVVVGTYMSWVERIDAFMAGSGLRRVRVWNAWAVAREALGMALRKWQHLPTWARYDSRPGQQNPFFGLDDEEPIVEVLGKCVALCQRHPLSYPPLQEQVLDALAAQALAHASIELPRQRARERYGLDEKTLGMRAFTRPVASAPMRHGAKGVGA